MKMFSKKRIFTVILALALLCQSVICGFAAASPVDVSGHGNEEAIEVLCGLELIKGYEDGTFKPENNITRAELVTLVMRLVGMADIPSSSEQKFSDVAADYWAAAYINHASGMGLIDGYPDGTFGPERNITLDETIKIVVSALGFGYEAEQRGGYPGGYNASAARLRLFKDVNNDGEAATRATVAQILYNTLEVKLPEYISGTGDNLSFEIGDTTVLSNLGIEFMSGVLTGAPGISLNNSFPLAADEVEIDGKIYSCTQTDLSNYIGLRVDYYVSADDVNGRKKVYYVDGRQDSDIVIDAQDISDKSTLRNVRYYVDNKERTQSLSSGALTVICNGKPLAASEMNDDIYNIESGSVTLRSSENNSVYDTVIIGECETYVVLSVSDDKIYDVFGRSFEYDLNSTHESYLFYKNGEVVSPKDYRRNDILSVARSKDGTYTKVVGTDSRLEGEVVASADDESREKYTVSSDGEEREFSLAKSYADALAAKLSDAKKLEIGGKYVLYLNTFGEIAYAEVTEEGGKELKYGFLVDTGTVGSMDTSFQMQIMTEDNTFETFETGGKKIRFGYNDGNSYSVERRTPEEIAAIVGSGMDCRQILQYGLDSDGKLAEVYLADTSTNGEYISRDQNTFTGTYSSGLLDEYWYIDEDTIVFHVPNELRYPELFKAVKAVDYFSKGSSANMTLYDVENQRVSAIVVTPVVDTYFLPEDGNEIVVDKVNSPVMLIESVRRTLNDDGVGVTSVRGYVGKKYVEEFLPSGYERNDFRPGVVIQYETNQIVLDRAYSSDYDKVIASYVVLADLSVENPRSFIEWNYGNIVAHNASIRTSVGTVYRKDLPGVVCNVERNGNVEEIPYVLNGGTAVLIYNRTGEKITVGTQEDINIGDVVFVRQRRNSVREFIIVR